MTRRLRIPAVLAVTIIGAVAGISTISSSGCEGGSRPIDAAADGRQCLEGVCLDNPNDGGPRCPNPGSCAVNFMCPDGCVVG